MCGTLLATHVSLESFPLTSCLTDSIGAEIIYIYIPNVREIFRHWEMMRRTYLANDVSECFPFTSCPVDSTGSGRI